MNNIHTPLLMVDVSVVGGDAPTPSESLIKLRTYETGERELIIKILDGKSKAKAESQGRT